MACKICESNKKIKDDPYFIAELETGYAVLGWFQRFKGYSVFVCKQHAAELHELPYDFKIKFLDEMSLVAEAIFNVYQPDKMNYELLGNGVSHLHWHLYPRVKGDTPKTGPIWQLPEEELRDEKYRPNPDEIKDCVKKLRAEINRLREKQIKK